MMHFPASASWRGVLLMCLHPSPGDADSLLYFLTTYEKISFGHVVSKMGNQSMAMLITKVILVHLKILERMIFSFNALFKSSSFIIPPLAVLIIILVFFIFLIFE